MKMSEYPVGTVIELPQWGLYIRREEDWSRIDGVDGYESDFDIATLEVIDERQAAKLPIIVTSVPWGFAKALIEMCHEMWIDNGYKVPEPDEPHKGVIKEALENYERQKQLDWLAEEEIRRIETEKLVKELRRKLEE